MKEFFYMTGQEFMEKVLAAYQEAFDITRPFDVNGHRYDAYAAFNVTSAKYVLIEKAELWRANCYEHTFFSCCQSFDREALNAFGAEVKEYIEPQIVRQGRGGMEKDHMYTFITGIFFSEEGISEELKKAVRKFHFFKNYRFGIRGYSEARLLVFDMKNRKVTGNRAAGALVKGYRKAF